MKLIYLINVILFSIIHAEILEDSASNALNKFGLKLLAETNGRLSENINLAISPYTVWVAMSIVNEGAMRNTAAQLESTLYIPPNNGTDRDAFRKQQQRLSQQITKSQDGVTLEILNSMFTKREAILKRNFVELVQDIYNVRVEPLDFNQPAVAAGRINNVISEATHGKITEIVDADKVREAYMFITSVLYFKGLWDKKFDKDDTKPEPFYNERKEKIATVQMMHTKGAFPFGQILDGKAIAVELPYVGQRVSMILIRPKQDKKSLTMILNELVETPFTKVYADIHKDDDLAALLDDAIDVYLPRFEISTTFSLNLVLDGLGIKDVFNANDADLENIAPNVELYVSRIMHYAKIQVDEDGTTATSATVVETESKMKPTIFRADRSFLFLLYDKDTKSIIFTGKYATPNRV